MCSEENKDRFEELKEEVKEAAQNLADAVKEKAEEWKEKAEEFCEQAEEAEDISDLGEEKSCECSEEKACECDAEKSCEGEACDFKADEDDAEEKKENRFIRRTPKGFEVDTNEIEEALRSFGEKISEAMNSVGRGVQDSINAAQDRANQKKKADKLAKLLPFMEEAEIHEIAEKVIAGDEEFKDVDIASLMPFMSKEDCSVLFEKSLEANDEKPGVDGKLYLKAVPYVGEEVLSKLVDRYVEGGFENIKMDNIYPYLSSADVKRIFYYELRK
ncbi:MAG: hypothetical protein IKS18_11510 [Lachnospiraceae bacterium]|nr:hypothetical protein [Lachnospiraceae bacterium]